MTIQEILDYIAKTPENANVNVLSGMLDELTSGGGGEGGGDITVEALSVTENGTYTAEEGKAYSPVTVNVPSTSEFSTAELTIIVENVGESTIPAANSSFPVYAPIKDWDGLEGKNICLASSQFDTSSSIAPNETYQGVFDVVLCNGVCVFNPFGWGSQNIAVAAGPGSATGSGNITIDQNTGDAKITGNATLTLKCEYYA